MNIKIEYFDNIINTYENIQALEIEDKKCFFRTVNNFISLSDGLLVEDIYCFDNDKNEINISNKILVVTDYFNMNNIFKKFVNNLQKYIIIETDDTTINDLSLKYKQLLEKLSKSFSEIDLPVRINTEFNLEQLIKFVKPTVETSNNLIDNIYLLLDLEKIFKLHKLIVFVNLKQYFTKEELIELYKYAIYNEIMMILIDNNSYNLSLEYEKKLLIDDNLDEYVL